MNLKKFMLLINDFYFYRADRAVSTSRLGSSHLWTPLNNYMSWYWLLTVGAVNAIIYSPCEIRKANLHFIEL